MISLFHECLDVYKYPYQTWEDAAKDSVDKIFDFADQCGNEHLGDIINNINNYIKNNRYLPDYELNVTSELDLLKSIINYYIDNNMQVHDPANMRYTSPTDAIDDSVQIHQVLFLLASVSSIRLFEKLKDDPQYSQFANSLMNRDFTTSTVIKKQHDYGPQNISKFGMWGLIVRLHDKIARLDNLMSTKRKGFNSVSNETIYDTLLDVVGYSTVALLWVNNWFLLPMKGDVND